MTNPLSFTYVRLLLVIALSLFFTEGNALISAAAPPYPVCVQPSLIRAAVPPLDNSTLDHQVYLPLIFGPPPLPLCTVYCGLAPLNDPYQPTGYRTYFADEFDCNQRLDYWTVQGKMTAASYIPPATGYVKIDNGLLQVGVPGRDTSFPYLYMVDDSATTYDVPHTTRRVDWLPNQGDFRLALRVRFKVDTLGEHRIALYADGHRPHYAGPLFYVGMDYNRQEEAWRGLIVGADRANSFVDLGDYGYADPYTGWVVVTTDFSYSTDTFTLSVDGVPRLTKPLSAFKGYPNAATRPDTLYLGSLALLQNPVPWTDFELDWLRVYTPVAAPEAVFGLLTATVEAIPSPTDAPSAFSTALPAGPFANTPHWSEHFNGSAMPAYWQRVFNPDPGSSWTEVGNSQASLRNDGSATGVPVWAIFDDMLPLHILGGLEAGRETPADYLRRRGGSPFWTSPPAPLPGGEGSQMGGTAIYPRFDWRPNEGNVRYAWRGRQTARGYGVEISNGGHFPYFTGAMFYTLQDSSSNGGQGQFIFPGCQEQYFWRLHRLPGYSVPHEAWTIVTADYVNGTVHLYVDGQKVGWWPESDCSLNWYLKGENATSPDILFFGNPATAPNAPGGWSEIGLDWFATFPGLARVEPPL
jgi:hypothetical protein